MAIPPPTGRTRADDVQIELLRRAGTARRFALASSLSESVIALSREAIRARDPSLDDREIKLRWVALHYGEELSAKVRRHLEQRGG